MIRKLGIGCWGRVDWLSKKWLMDQVALDASWSVRKKVDLRYHELSSEGYLYKLQDALQIHSSLDETLVERAIRNPPMGHLLASEVI